MKKRFIIEWVILLAILIIIIPIVMVKVSNDGDELFSFFRIVIRYVLPPSILILILSQVWRKKRKESLSK